MDKLLQLCPQQIYMVASTECVIASAKYLVVELLLNFLLK